MLIAELPGISVFYKDVPKGRDEESGGSRWIRRRDKYADATATSCH